MIPFTSLCIGITGVALVYVAVKTVLWWAVTGTLGLLFGRIPFSSWLVRSLRGALGVLLAAVCGVVLAGISYRTADPYWLLEVFGVAGALLSLRVFWRELITLCGLLAGDWNPLRPNLRFFGWGGGVPNPLALLHSAFAGDRGPSSVSRPGDESDAIEALRRQKKDIYGYSY